MKVDVIIPCAGSGRFFPATLRSILAQSYKNFRVIVCDNACAHNVFRDLVADCGDARVEYRHFETRLPLISNWQRAKEQAVSELFCIVHDDDIWKADFLETGVVKLSDPGVAYVLACHAPFFSEEDCFRVSASETARWASLAALSWRELRVLQGFVPLAHLSAGIFRNIPVVFDPLHIFNGDQAFFIELGFRGEGRINCATVVGIRQHNESCTSMFPRAQASREIVSLIRSAMVRLHWAGISPADAITKNSHLLGPGWSFQLLRSLFSWPLYPELIRLGATLHARRKFMAYSAGYSRLARFMSKAPVIFWISLGVALDGVYYFRIRKTTETFINK